MAFILDETTYTTPNRTPSALVAQVFGYARIIDGVTIHHWGADGQNAQAVAQFLSRPGGSTSAHFVLQEGLVYCLSPIADATWHAGSAKGNATTVGVECRPEMTRGDFDTLVEFVQWLEKLLGKSLNIYAHQWWFNTACPGRYLGKIDELVARVNGESSITVETLSPTGGGTMQYPVEGYTMSQPFGNTGTAAYNSGATGHAGVDWATPTGTPTVAVADGTVLWADWAYNLPRTTWADRWYLAGGGFGGVAGDSGITVVIDHGDYLSTYSHLHETQLNTGDRVHRGAVVGLTGATGRVTGPHLHFAIIPKPFDWGNGYYGCVDPIPFIKARLATKENAMDEKAVERVMEGVLYKQRLRHGIGGTASLADQIMWGAQDFKVTNDRVASLENQVATLTKTVEETGKLVKNLISGGAVNVQAVATVDAQEIAQAVMEKLERTKMLVTIQEEE